MDSVALGKQAEKLVAQSLRKLGRYVLNLGQYDGALNLICPMFEDTTNKLPACDLLTIHRGTASMIHVASKNAPSNGCHGIEKHKIDNYTLLQMLSGITGYIAIYERKTANILITSLDTFLDSQRVVTYYDDKQAKRIRMCFVPRTIFKEMD